MNLLELANRIGITGFLHCAELDALVEFAAGKDVLEVGSYRGLSAWGMGCVAKTLTCIDTFKPATNGLYQLDNTTTLRPFLQAIARFSPAHVLYYVGTSQRASADIMGEYDVIFVDAAHDEINVSLDIDLWWPRLRIGGHMLFHDYGHSDAPDVKRVLDKRFGPAQESEVCVTLRWVKKSVE